MKRPVLFILLGGLAVGSGLITQQLRSGASSKPAALAGPTNAAAAKPERAEQAKATKPAGAPARADAKADDAADVDPDQVNLSETLKRVRAGGEAGALRFDNPDLMSVLQELDRRASDLNRRELELKQLHDRIIAEQAALQSLTTRVASMQQRLDDSIRLRLDKIRQAERDRREATGRKWAGLQPAEVVPLAVGLPPEETLAVLRTLPRETAAKIVEALAKNGSNGARQLVDMMQQAATAQEDRGARP